MGFRGRDEHNFVLTHRLRFCHAVFADLKSFIIATALDISILSLVQTVWSSLQLH